MMGASGAKTAKVLAVTGSSGGHIFPAISLLDSLKENEPSAEVLLVLPGRSIKDLIGSLGYPAADVSIVPLRLSLGPGNIAAALRFLKGSFEELAVLLRFRPDLVVGFGSLSSVPMVLFARIWGIKTMVHEQNVMPGMANRLLAFFADRVALSFADTADYLKCPRHKMIVTGNPLRRQMAPLDKAEARDYFGLSRDKFTILVSGGSQSSSNVNEGFLKAVRQLRERSSFQLIHLAGRNDCRRLREEYEKNGIEARVFSFLDSMQYAYSASDVAVSRSGATTIAELIFFRIPAILVPYPHARKHQYANAEVLRRSGCAVIVEDEEFGKSGAARILEGLLQNKEELSRMRSNYQGLESRSSRERMREAVSEMLKSNG